MSGPKQFSFANAEHAAPGATVVQFGDTAEGAAAEAYSTPAPQPRPQRKPTPKNIVALAKARLREVKAELKRMKALEKERGELERLIHAAKGKPVVTTTGKVAGHIKAAG